MRVWCGVVVIAGSLAGLAAAARGCERRKDARPAVTFEHPKRNFDEQAPVETDPTKLLYRALVHRDPQAVHKILLAHPELINKPINESYPLALACESRSLPLVQAMCDRGADLKVRTAEGSSMLWCAVNSDSLPIAKYLIDKGADVKALESDGETVLWAAQTVEMAKLLTEKGVDPRKRDNVGDMALHNACRKSRKDVVEYFLNLGIDIETRGHWDMPPLHFAVTTLTGEPRPVVRMLLQRGANINSRGWNGNTVIHECAIYNRYEMAEFLLTRGAEANAKDAKGDTPIDLAVVAGREDRAKLIELLQRYGAQIKGEEIKKVK
jgi:cytohesin